MDHEGLDDSNYDDALVFTHALKRAMAAFALLEQANGVRAEAGVFSLLEQANDILAESEEHREYLGPERAVGDAKWSTLASLPERIGDRIRAWGLGRYATFLARSAGKELHSAGCAAFKSIYPFRP